MFRIDLSTPDYTGYLYKKSQWLREWRKRYFVLKGKKLYFSENASSEHHGIIHLDSIINITCIDENCIHNSSVEKEKCYFQLVTRYSGTYYFYIENKDMRNVWVRAIERAIIFY
jgi:hypothetical protein